MTKLALQLAVRFLNLRVVSRVSKTISSSSDTAIPTSADCGTPSGETLPSTPSLQPEINSNSSALVIRKKIYLAGANRKEPITEKPRRHRPTIRSHNSNYLARPRCRSLRLRIHRAHRSRRGITHHNAHARSSCGHRERKGKPNLRLRPNHIARLELFLQLSSVLAHLLVAIAVSDSHHRQPRAVRLRSPRQVAGLHLQQVTVLRRHRLDMQPAIDQCRPRCGRQIEEQLFRLLLHRVGSDS